MLLIRGYVDILINYLCYTCYMARMLALHTFRTSGNDDFWAIFRADPGLIEVASGN